MAGWDRPAMPYDFDAAQYEQASAHQMEWGVKLVSELGLRGSERVLDLGCGDGTLAAAVAKSVPRGEVVGIDASPGMIEAAKAREKANLRFALMDIGELDFEDEFDVVYSNAALHWVKDHERLLANVARALRQAGRVRFNFAGAGNSSNFIMVIRAAMAREGFAPYFKGFAWPWYMPPVIEYRRLVQRTGLREVAVWAENADRFFPDVETLLRWVEQPSLVPFLACVAEGDKPAFKEHVFEEMIKATRQDDGRCFETFRRVNLSARK
jgi:trans-aconitate 2-methyltransferase